MCRAPGAFFGIPVLLILRHNRGRHARGPLALQVPQLAAAQHLHRRAVTGCIDVGFGERRHVGGDHPILGPVERAWIGLPS